MVPAMPLPVMPGRVRPGRGRSVATVVAAAPVLPRARRRRDQRVRQPVDDGDDEPLAVEIDPELDERDNAPPDEHLPLNPETFDTRAPATRAARRDRAGPDLGFRHPTHIQARLIPVFLTGRDILGQAKTGTGKTAAFALPLLHMVKRGEWGQALILAPTRELAIQIHGEFQKLGKHMPVRAVPIYGGQPIRTQAAKLEQGCEIIVGTPCGSWMTSGASSIHGRVVRRPTRST